MMVGKPSPPRGGSSDPAVWGGVAKAQRLAEEELCGQREALRAGVSECSPLA